MSNKFNARRTVVDNIAFASQKEAGRYVELRTLARAGIIRDLQIHPRWALVVEGVRVGAYTADFGYQDVERGVQVVEDVKGAATCKLPDYQLRKKLMMALHGSEVVEV